VANVTIKKFKYPDSLLKEYESWVVLLRPAQVTAGSMVLACKQEATALSQLSAEVFAELAAVTADLEGALRKTFGFDKINYLCLMMVDKHVHFHVIPRYASSRGIAGVEFHDTAWPGPADLSAVVDVSDAQFNEILETLRANWNQREDHT